MWGKAVCEDEAKRPRLGRDARAVSTPWVAICPTYVVLVQISKISQMIVLCLVYSKTLYCPDQFCRHPGQAVEGAVGHRGSPVVSV